MSEFLIEKWVEIEEYPSYSVSNYGRVWDWRKDCAVSYLDERNGFKIFTFYKNQKRDRVALHRLVAALFLPDYDPLYSVVHKNGDKHDNRSSNLKMGTKKTKGGRVWQVKKTGSTRGVPHKGAWRRTPAKTNAL